LINLPLRYTRVKSHVFLPPPQITVALYDAEKVPLVMGTRGLGGGATIAVSQTAKTTSAVTTAAAATSQTHLPIISTLMYFYMNLAYAA
jgi:hypothetical protein